MRKIGSVHVIVVGVLGTVLTAVAASFTLQIETNKQELEFREQVRQIVSALNFNLVRYTDVISSLGDFFRARAGVLTRQEFDILAERYIQEFTGIRVLQYAPKITHQQRQSFERSIRNQGFPNFNITERVGDRLLPPQTRDFYVPINYIYPFAPNAVVFGFDLASEPVRAQAIQSAIRSGEVEITAPITLVQDRRYGFLSFLPTYSSQTAKREVTGFLVGVFRFDDILEAAFAGFQLPVTIYLYDTTDQSSPIFFGFYHPPDPKMQSKNPPSFEELKILASQNRICQNLDTCLTAINIANREWSIFVVPEVNYAVGKNSNFIAVIFIGIISTLAISIYLIVLIANETKLSLVYQEINRLNVQLKDENMRISSELNIVRQMQDMITPASQELKIAGTDIAGYMEPALEVGGDYYDVIFLDGTTTIAIGDVTGHGLESGILMLMVQTAIRTLKDAGFSDHKSILSILNSSIYKNIQRMNVDKNLTLSILSYCDGCMKISGQHEEVIVIRESGEYECLDTVPLGFLIGLEPNIDDFIDQIAITLAVGDGLVLYTDGITEAQNGAKQFYGLQRLLNALIPNWSLSSQEILEIAIQDLHRFIDGQELFDDISMVVFKRTG